MEISPLFLDLIPVTGGRTRDWSSVAKREKRGARREITYGADVVSSSL
jgi:hypothetical protein